MALTDLWDYLRTTGDPRLRQQGYPSSGMGLLERFQRSSAFWMPHLERNRGNLSRLSLQLPARGGTLLVLGAGRLLDVPWQDLFPKFERVVLFDADGGIAPFVERMLAQHATPLPTPAFEIGDCTDSVVQVAAWAEHTIQTTPGPDVAARLLEEGLRQADPPAPAWPRAFADVRMAVSTNLLSQLGHFPRLHIQTAFKKRFERRLREFDRASEALERYFCRVRARHIQALASFAGASAYLSSDVEVWTYALQASSPEVAFKAPLPPDAGVTVDERGRPRFAWPVTLERGLDPLHDQRIQDLWPAGVALERPQRWAWHIVPQAHEQGYPDYGRIHLVEAWIKTASGHPARVGAA